MHYSKVLKVSQSVGRQLDRAAHGCRLRSDFEDGAGDVVVLCECEGGCDTTDACANDDSVLWHCLKLGLEKHDSLQR